MSSLSYLLPQLGAGFASALVPTNLLLGAVGVTVGTAIGVLPGLGPALTISLLLPLTFGMDPVGTFILFGGIYYGAMYGGSTTSILVRMPGETSSVMTAVDGYAMTRRGRAGAALATAAIGSFVAGTFATVMLMLLAPPLVELSLGFGPADYAALMVLALTSVAGLAGANPARGLLAIFVGLALGTVGIDVQTGQARFSMGMPGLLGGLNVVLVTVGLFAVGEVFWHAATRLDAPTNVTRLDGPARLTPSEWRRSMPAWGRGTLIGFFTGVLPGAGATVASFLSYDVERRVSKTPEEFGEGAIEGVAGPEAANNASAGGSLVPLLALGVPGSGTTAVMLAAFQMYGLQPGPLLFSQESELVWGLIASLYVSNALLLLLNLPLIRLWVRLLEVPPALLYAAVLALATVGVYTLNSSLFDVGVVYALGLLAVVLRHQEIPLAPVVLGAVLGPLLEQYTRRALAIADGDPTVFLTRPLSAALLGLALALVVLPPLVRATRTRT
ncbi:MAG: tripartite tricarboxylate transporter TctA [Acidobacteria bacterium]|nr:tripartite tricarboxylate transporter TctA [Acidobacteriota bacterium]|tara:strand:- start:2003 stop:3502 length:1500 start_codon:yes stop_codon:yes gene_type:complete